MGERADAFGGGERSRAGCIWAKDPEVHTVYLDMAARWRRMAAQQEGIDGVPAVYEKREK